MIIGLRQVVVLIKSIRKRLSLSYAGWGLLSSLEMVINKMVAASTFAEVICCRRSRVRLRRRRKSTTPRGRRLRLRRRSSPEESWDASWIGPEVELLDFLWFELDADS